MKPPSAILSATIVVGILAAISSVHAASDCSDGFCPIPQASDGEPEITVLSPVPESAVEPIAPAPRLKSLEGKTVALVGGSFMANVTHPELKRLILAEFPTAKVYLLNEIGSAGPYPRPGVVRREKDAFQRKLKEFRVDAVVSGNGGCGLCTPKETGSCIAAEVLGIPSVMIAAAGFVKQAMATAASAGLAELRVAEYPGAFASHTREELLENTRKALWPQVKAGLTGEMKVHGSEFKVHGSPPKEASLQDDPAIVGTFDEIQRVFLDSGWTDGLPVVPPTEGRVAEFLRFTDLPPERSLGAIPPAQRDVTVRHVAVNGVMAGCPPEFMPVLLAFVEAMKDGDFRRTLSSTHAWTPYCWLNGPVSRQLGFDSGQGEISEPRNAVLGRFISLALLNLGGYRVKENRMGTFGYLMPWCVAEDEAAALRIGWMPYHLQRGHAIDDSTLTAASAINWGNNLVPATSAGERIKDMMAWDAAEKSQMAVGSGMPCTYRTFLITEGVARDLAKTYATKDALCRALEETARIPLGQRAFANYWGNPGSAFDPAKYPLRAHERRVAAKEGAMETATPPWLAWTGAERMETVPAMEPGKSAFLVTGDPSRNKVLTVPGGGFATVRIELPAAWDALMAERGYRPLSEFRLAPVRDAIVPQTTMDAGAPVGGGEFLAFDGAPEDTCIAKYPVTNGDYAKFVKETGHQPPRYWKGGAFPAGKDKHPVLWVSLRDANAYCAWLGGKDAAHSYRLPTAAEWEAAAGPTPDGAEFNFNGVVASHFLKADSDRLVEYVHPKSVRKSEKSKLSDVIAISPGGVRGWVDHANYTGFIYTDLFREISEAGGWTTPVDAYPQTKAACGALDMWGNCWEWTSTEITATNGAERGQKVNAIKGGSWYANRRSCRTDFQGEGRRPDGHYNTVGFRVVRCSDPKSEET